MDKPQRHEKLGLHAPDDRAEWVELTSLPGMKVNLDVLSQQVSITAEAEALEGQQHLTASKPAPMYRYPDAQPVSAYTLGYALYASDAQGSASSTPRPC